jgi:hypothetical protein
VGDSIDYVQSGALVVPPSYLYLPDHITPFPPPTSSEWVILVLHLLSFIPVGLLLMWTRRPSITVAIRDNHDLRSGPCTYAGASSSSMEDTPRPPTW